MNISRNGLCFDFLGGESKDSGDSVLNLNSKCLEALFSSDVDDPQLNSPTGRKHSIEPLGIDDFFNQHNCMATSVSQCPVRSMSVEVTKYASHASWCNYTKSVGRTRFTDKDLAVVMTRLDDLIAFRDSKYFLDDDQWSPHKGESKATVVQNTLQDRRFCATALNYLEALCSTTESKSCATKKLRVLVSVYALRARCVSSLERNIVDSILTQGDFQLAYNNIDVFTQFLCSVAFDNMKYQRRTLITSMIGRKLEPYCRTLPCTGQDSPRVCRYCGSNRLILIHHSEEDICEVCGETQSAVAELEETLFSADNSFCDGRQFVEDLGLYHRFSTSTKRQRRIKNAILFSVRCICTKLRIMCESQIILIANAVAQYAPSGRTAKRTLVIAACIFLVLCNQETAVSIPRLATALKIHASSLCSAIRRVSRVLGIRYIPPIDYMSIAINSLQQCSESELLTTHSQDTTTVRTEILDSNVIRREKRRRTLSPWKPRNVTTLDMFESSTTFDRSDAVLDDTPHTSSAKTLDYRSNDTLAALLNELLETDTAQQPKVLPTVESLLTNNDSPSTCAQHTLDSRLCTNTTTAGHRPAQPCGKARGKLRRKKHHPAHPLANHTQVINTAKALFRVYNQMGKNSQTTEDQKPPPCSKDLYVVSACLYYASKYHHIHIPADSLAETLNINKGSFNRERHEFVARFDRFLQHSGLCPNTPTRQWTTHEKNRTVIATILSNTSLLETVLVKDIVY